MFSKPNDYKNINTSTYIKIKTNDSKDNIKEKNINKTHN